MSNPNNTVHAVGHLAADPRKFQNDDGSQRVVFTVYADNNFPSRDGQWKSEPLDFEAYIRPGVEFAKTPFGKIFKGDKVNILAHLKKKTFTRDGKTVYEMKVEVDQLVRLSTQQESEARLAKRVAEAETKLAETQATTQAPGQDAWLANADDVPAEAELVGAGADSGERLPWQN